MKPNVINICQQCKKSFIAKKGHRHKQPYCSRKCSYIGHKTGEIRNCIECNKKIYIAKFRLIENKSRGKFCNNICRYKNWARKAMETENPTTYRTNAWRIFEKKCYDCGYIIHPEIILIHHIDGNRKNGSIKNLIPVCQNCHCLRHIKLNGNSRLPSYRRESF